MHPGQPLTRKHQRDKRPGHSYFYPGHRDDYPGHRDDYPGHWDDYPGHWDDYPGHRDDYPGHRDDYPGHRDDHPGDPFAKTGVFSPFFCTPLAPKHPPKRIPVSRIFIPVTR